MSAVPELEISGTQTKWGWNRAHQFEREGKEVPLPEVGEHEGAYLLRALMSAGPTAHSEMGGTTPLGWQDIYYYSRCTGSLEKTWEKEAIKKLSHAYWRGYIDGKDAWSSIPPSERDEHPYYD